jgi:hypothetical protein
MMQHRTAVLAMKNFAFLFALLLGSYALAQDTPAQLHGSWTATVGPTQVFRGSWTASVVSRNPNSGRGTWSLYIDADQSVMQGTWAAQKSAGEWSGTWSARTSQGRSFNGTWSSGDANLTGKTLQDMLQRAMQQEIGGNWRGGTLGGNWWLRGPTKTSK